MSSGITIHMVVKNEDRWVWYAIHAVLPYVDYVFITDTGSTDHTVSLIKSIASPKIVFRQITARNRLDVTKARQSQIDNTKTPWIWIVDGDEIYPSELMDEVVGAIRRNKYELIVVRRFDLLGDVYHKQVETVGAYNMFGQSGHFLIRLINKSKLADLHVMGEYPLESYYTKNDICVNDLEPSVVYVTKKSLFHTMYLKRSTLGGNLAMFNRSKYKIEAGIKIDSPYPAVFDFVRPPHVPDPLAPRGFAYDVLASIITPVKNFKRKYL